MDPNIGSRWWVTNWNIPLVGRTKRTLIRSQSWLSEYWVLREIRVRLTLLISGKNRWSILYLTPVPLGIRQFPPVDLSCHYHLTRTFTVSLPLGLVHLSPGVLRRHFSSRPGSQNKQFTSQLPRHSFTSVLVSFLFSLGIYRFFLQTSSSTSPHLPSLHVSVVTFNINSY